MGVKPHRRARPKCCRRADRYVKDSGLGPGAGLPAAHARAFLQGWSGHLMVDDYVGYKALFVPTPPTSQRAPPQPATQEPTPPPAQVIELGCMAHALRRFRVCLQPRRRTISTLPPGSPMCSGNFPRGRTVGSMNCCRLQGIASVNAQSAMVKVGRLDAYIRWALECKAKTHAMNPSQPAQQI